MISRVACLAGRLLRLLEVVGFWVLTYTGIVCDYCCWSVVLTMAHVLGLVENLEYFQKFKLLIHSLQDVLTSITICQEGSVIRLMMHFSNHSEWSHSLLSQNSACITKLFSLTVDIVMKIESIFTIFVFEDIEVLKLIMNLVQVSGSKSWWREPFLMKRLVHSYTCNSHIKLYDLGTFFTWPVDSRYSNRIITTRIKMCPREMLKQ